MVEGADKINVTLYDDRNGNKRYEAKLVGKDARTDVALLKIEPKETLSPIELGDSDAGRGRRMGDGHRQPLRPRR